MTYLKRDTDNLLVSTVKDVVNALTQCIDNLTLFQLQPELEFKQSGSTIIAYLSHDNRRLFEISITGSGEKFDKLETAEIRNCDLYFIKDTINWEFVAQTSLASSLVSRLNDEGLVGYELQFPEYDLIDKTIYALKKAGMSAENIHFRMIAFKKRAKVFAMINDVIMSNLKTKYATMLGTNWSDSQFDDFYENVKYNSTAYADIKASI